MTKEFVENNIPFSAEQISPDWLTYVLRQSKVIHLACVEELEVVPLRQSKGYIGQIVQLELTYSVEENAPKALIAKFSSANPEMLEIGRDYGFYAREVNFYKHIARHINIETPKCYYSNIDKKGEKHILLLEELATARSGDRKLGCSIDEAKAAINALVSLHTSWWESPQLTRLNWLPDLNTVYDFSLTPSIFNASWEVFKKKAQLISPYARDLGERFSEHVVQVSNYLFQTPPRTLIHFDFHLDNLFFRNDHNKVTLIAIDWQLITRGRGIVDVAFFLGQNLDPELRSRYEEELLILYHEGLLAKGIENYSFETCWHDYQMALLYHFFGLVFSLGAESFTSNQDRFLIDHIIPRNVLAIEQLDAGKLIL